MSLTFDQVRQANVERLPQFKSKHGKLAHSTPDGHDWTPAQWLQAFVGELGEYAEARVDFEAGRLSHEAYGVEAGKEIADFMLYGDILARRALDTVTHQTNDAANLLMRCIACIGAYANARKKFDRGDMDITEMHEIRDRKLTAAISYLMDIRGGQTEPHAPVRNAHPNGVDLGKVIAQKFNEVSNRIGVNVFLPE